MKPISILALAASLVIGLAGCERLLEVKPATQVLTEEVLSTPEGIESFLVGTYNIATGGALYGTNILQVPDLLTVGETDWAGTFAGYQQFENTTVGGTNIILINNAEATRTWLSSYSLINSANNVIKAADAVITDPAQRQRVKGEALFLRGIGYFNLARMYCRQWDPAVAANNTAANTGVPIRTEPVPLTVNEILDLPPLARSTLAETYARIEADLVGARDSLTANLNPINPTIVGGRSFRAGKLVARAFLMRVYLQQSRFAEAEVEAAAIRASAAYSLRPGIQPSSQDENQEGIWAMQQNVQDNAGTANDGLATFWFFRGSPDLRAPSTTFLNNIYTEPGDLRRTTWFGFDRNGNGAITGAELRVLNKWNNQTVNYIVLRYAEVLLVEAEARLRQLPGSNEPDVTALTNVNVVRQRAGLPALVSVDGAAATEIDDNTELLTAVMNERRRELYAEGHRLYDLRRLGIANGPYSSVDELLLPIPLDETLVNPVMVQNPEYL